jgi:hypothetical protein
MDRGFYVDFLRNPTPPRASEKTSFSNKNEKLTAISCSQFRPLSGLIGTSYAFIGCVKTSRLAEVLHAPIDNDCPTFSGR